MGSQREGVEIVRQRRNAASTTSCAATTARCPACRDANYITPIDPNISPGQCGWTSDITYYSDNLNTNFNAAQVTLAQNLLKGLDYTANYQWASAFADSTQYASWDRHVAHGRDSNVRLQQLTWYGTYELPFGRNKQFASGANGVTNMIIGGWQLSGTVNWGRRLAVLAQLQRSEHERTRQRSELSELYGNRKDEDQPDQVPGERRYW